MNRGEIEKKEVKKEEKIEKMKVELLTSTQYLNDFIAETTIEEEYSPEKKIIEM